MKTAPLHFKINYLAIEQQELINYGNKFVIEIYGLVIQSWAMGILGWGGRLGIPKEIYPPQRAFLPQIATAWNSEDLGS